MVTSSVVAVPARTPLNAAAKIDFAVAKFARSAVAFCVFIPILRTPVYLLQSEPEQLPTVELFELFPVELEELLEDDEPEVFEEPEVLEDVLGGEGHVNLY